MNKLLPNTKYFLYTLGFLLLFNKVTSQLVYNVSSVDLGDVLSSDEKFFDFQLTNLSSKNSHFLRYKKKYGIHAIVSKKIIAPDSTILVRIKYTPKRKGKFNIDVPLWFSSNNKPIVFTIKGKALNVDIKEKLECPSFKKRKSPKILKKSRVTLNVLDEASSKPIVDAKIDVMWGGLHYKNLKTNRKGIGLINVGYHNYTIIAEADGYKKGSKEVTINKSKTNIKIFLNKGDESSEILVEKEKTIPFYFDWEKIPVKNPTPIEKEKIVFISSELLPENKFKPNNIVFLIDNSISMRKENRMPLLRTSMIALLNQLRTIDKLSIITYASSTKVLLSGEYVKNKAHIKEIINNIKTAGFTNGEKGIAHAISLANTHYIKKGNNQIIVATDGSFEVRKNGGLVKKLKRNAKKGIRFSVVGVKNSTWAKKSMLQLSNAGNGSYLSIANPKIAKTALIKEIQNKSKIKY